ncbi:Epidermal growth factor-like domain and EGF-like calcium-binding domain-containing protein [Strongyloides ratti]|uniref:Epidermal growth factor-like domain and EGF-like calcium-binding domain-containing protein n=1 Tax=Strongyloides ratti TaxID=34506 RepID=A0A090L7E8_STRRB|nr:Epidermal growth factor-like domain and EGF-like calcium-binding domain-containing protein [Strongyloides ratti]CEF65681.1 Epidermal growth factor-like domain and EGF-like calcium-binding domain-containing protein [Strongyloides ratti]
MKSCFVPIPRFNERGGYYSMLDTVSRLGRIAAYMRVFRRYIKAPNGLSDFSKLFPDYEFELDSKIMESCTEHIWICVDTISKAIESRASIFFHVDPTNDIETFDLNEEIITEKLTNNMFEQDYTIAYILCFLTTNRSPCLKHLPFCKYRVDSKYNKWPTKAFNFKNKHFVRDEFFYNYFGQHEPIDTLGEFEPWKCAEESFCPDPCCGRWEKRSETCIALDRCPTQKDGDSLIVKHCELFTLLNRNFEDIVKNNWNTTCSCQKGKYEYDLDLQICVDIDECQKEVGRCGRNQECVNYIGSYACLCRLGFIKTKNGSCIANHNVRKNDWHSHNYSPLQTNNYS